MNDNEQKFQMDDISQAVSILIAEDNEQVRKLTEIVLVQNGYKVITAENGLEALDLLISGNYQLQLLLTDLNMPELNGMELYSRVKEFGQKVRVIYMSGYSEDILGSEEAADPFVFFLQKPFTINTLLSTVRNALSS